MSTPAVEPAAAPTTAPPPQHLEHPSAPASVHPTPVGTPLVAPAAAPVATAAPPAATATPAAVEVADVSGHPVEEVITPAPKTTEVTTTPATEDLNASKKRSVSIGKRIKNLWKGKPKKDKTAAPVQPPPVGTTTTITTTTTVVPESGITQPVSPTPSLPSRDRVEPPPAVRPTHVAAPPKVAGKGAGGAPPPGSPHSVPPTRSGSLAPSVHSRQSPRVAASPQSSLGARASHAGSATGRSPSLSAAPSVARAPSLSGGRGVVRAPSTSGVAASVAAHAAVHAAAVRSNTHSQSPPRSPRAGVSSVVHNMIMGAGRGGRGRPINIGTRPVQQQQRPQGASAASDLVRRVGVRPGGVGPQRVAVPQHPPQHPPHPGVGTPRSRSSQPPTPTNGAQRLAHQVRQQALRNRSPQGQPPAASGSPAALQQRRVGSVVPPPAVSPAVLPRSQPTSPRHPPQLMPRHNSVSGADETAPGTVQSQTASARSSPAVTATPRPVEVLPSHRRDSSSPRERSASPNTPIHAMVASPPSPSSPQRGSFDFRQDTTPVGSVNAKGPEVPGVMNVPANVAPPVVSGDSGTPSAAPSPPNVSGTWVGLPKTAVPQSDAASSSLPDGAEARTDFTPSPSSGGSTSKPEVAPILPIDTSIHKMSSLEKNPPKSPTSPALGEVSELIENMRDLKRLAAEQQRRAELSPTALSTPIHPAKSPAPATPPRDPVGKVMTVFSEALTKLAEGNVTDRRSSDTSTNAVQLAALMHEEKRARLQNLEHGERMERIGVVQMDCNEREVTALLQREGRLRAQQIEAQDNIHNALVSAIREMLHYLAYPTVDDLVSRSPTRSPRSIHDYPSSASFPFRREADIYAAPELELLPPLLEKWRQACVDDYFSHCGASLLEEELRERIDLEQSESSGRNIVITGSVSAIEARARERIEDAARSDILGNVLSPKKSMSGVPPPPRMARVAHNSSVAAMYAQNSLSMLSRTSATPGPAVPPVPYRMTESPLRNDVVKQMIDEVSNRVFTPFTRNTPPPAVPSLPRRTGSPLTLPSPLPSKKERYIRTPRQREIETPKTVPDSPPHVPGRVTVFQRPADDVYSTVSHRSVENPLNQFHNTSDPATTSMLYSAATSTAELPNTTDPIDQMPVSYAAHTPLSGAHSVGGPVLRPPPPLPDHAGGGGVQAGQVGTVTQRSVAGGKGMLTAVELTLHTRIDASDLRVYSNNVSPAVCINSRNLIPPLSATAEPRHSRLAVLAHRTQALFRECPSPWHAHCRQSASLCCMERRVHTRPQQTPAATTSRGPCAGGATKP